MDSKLVVEQMSGRWQIKHPGLRPLAAEAADAGAPVRRGDASRGSRASATSAPTRWPTRRWTAPAPRRTTAGRDAAPADASSAAAPAVAAGRGGGRRRWAPPAAGRATRLHPGRHGETALTAQRPLLRPRRRAAAPTRGAGAGAGGRRRGSAALADRVVAAVRHLAAGALRAHRRADRGGVPAASPVVVEHDLIECDFGEWEGLTFAEVRERWPAEMDALAGVDRRSRRPAASRSRRSPTRVRAGRRRGCCDDVPGSAVVVVVSHVSPIKLILRDALAAGDAFLHRLLPRPGRPVHRGLLAGRRRRRAQRQRHRPPRRSDRLPSPGGRPAPDRCGREPALDSSAASERAHEQDAAPTTTPNDDDRDAQHARSAAGGPGARRCSRRRCVAGATTATATQSTGPNSANATTVTSPTTAEMTFFSALIAGQRVGEHQAQRGDQHDAERGAEVAAVDARRRRPCACSGDASARRGGSSCGWPTTRRSAILERRATRRGAEHQERHHELERAGRREQQQRAAERPSRRPRSASARSSRRRLVARPGREVRAAADDARERSPGTTATELVTFAGTGGRPVATSAGKRDQRAAAGDRVDRAGGQAGAEQQGESSVSIHRRHVASGGCRRTYVDWTARRTSRPGGRVGALGRRRGTSGLHRAGWLLTATRGDPRDSATENRPPAPTAPVRVKRWGKSPPAPRVTGVAR